jgi:hypothetical protein
LTLAIVAAAVCATASLDIVRAAELTVTPRTRITKVYIPDERPTKPWKPSPWGPRWTANSWAYAEFDLFERITYCGTRPMRDPYWTGNDWIGPRRPFCYP